MTIENALIEIPPKDAFAVFTTESALDPILARVRAEIDKFEPDVETVGGRKAIASMAHKIAKSKTYLDGVGKDLTDEAKKVPKKIDAARKHARDTLDEWKAEVRKPLTDWEEAEETRTQGHVDAIERIKTLASLNDPMGEPWDSHHLRDHLEEVEAAAVDDRCEEFQDEYVLAKKNAIAALTVAVAKKEKQEADAAELAAHRKEAEEREAREREEAIKREAAEKAKAEAEAKAREEAEAKERAAQAAKKEAEHRERELKQAAEDAERRAREAKEKAEQEVADAKARDEAAAAAREADKEHRRKVNNGAVEALEAGGIPKSQAVAVVTLIAEGSVPSVSISY